MFAFVNYRPRITKVNCKGKVFVIRVKDKTVRCFFDRSLVAVF